HRSPARPELLHLQSLLISCRDHPLTKPEGAQIQRQADIVMSAVSFECKSRRGRGLMVPTSLRGSSQFALQASLFFHLRRHETAKQEIRDGRQIDRRD